MFEEHLRGVSIGDMYVDDIQLPSWADQVICRTYALQTCYTSLLCIILTVPKGVLTEEKCRIRKLPSYAVSHIGTDLGPG